MLKRHTSPNNQGGGGWLILQLAENLSSKLMKLIRRRWLVVRDHNPLSHRFTLDANYCRMAVRKHVQLILAKTVVQTSIPVDGFYKAPKASPAIPARSGSIANPRSDELGSGPFSLRLRNQPTSSAKGYSNTRTFRC